MSTQKLCPKPIEDQAHFGHAFDYIFDHEKRGAIVIVPEEPDLRPGQNVREREEEFLRDFGVLE